MTALEMICGGRSKPKMEIVWRNGKSVRSSRRYHSFQRESERDVYLMQEYVEDGRFGYWSTISDLEVVAGGRAA